MNHMPNQIKYNQPEKKIVIEVSVRELKMIKIVRSIQWGGIIIKKKNDVIFMIEPTTSILIDDEEAVDSKPNKD